MKQGIDNEYYVCTYMYFIFHTFHVLCILCQGVENSGKIIKMGDLIFYFA